jgi:hypothetical protein
MDANVQSSSTGVLKHFGKASFALVAVFVFLLLSVGLLLIVRNREPSYQGRPLTVWLAQYSTNHFQRRGSIADKEAEHAIQEIGTNAIPTLLALLRSDSVLAKKLAQALPKRISTRIYLDNHLRLASHGFVALGTNGHPALLELIALSKETNRDVRYTATYSLGHLGSAAEPAIPRLTQLVDDGEGSVRDQALMSLSMIHLNPPLVVPVLIKCATALERNIPERTAAIRGLRYYEVAVSEILPVLLKLKEDSDPNIRAEATNSIRWITPSSSSITGE